MKRSPLIFLFAGLLLSGFCAQKGSGERFSYSPEKPTPGSEITLRYNPAGRSLEEASKIDCVVYLYSKGVPEAKEFSMEKTKNVWTASFTTNITTRGVIIKFLADSEADNNDKQGYTITLYGEDGKPVPGGLAGLAEACSSWGRYSAGLDFDKELTLAKFDEDFKLHPEIKRDYLSSYLTLLASLRTQEGNETIVKELEELGKKEDLSLEELAMMVNLYKRISEPEAAEHYAEIIRKKDPKGDFFQSERFMEFYQTKDIDKKLALLEKFKKEFPGSPRLSTWNTYILLAYQQRGDYNKVKEYLGKCPEVNSSICNNIAWDMAQKNINLELAEEIAKKAVDLAREERLKPPTEKPPAWTEKEWQENLGFSLGMALDTYGFILLKLNKAGALPALEEAVQLTHEKSAEINERYAEALVKSGSAEKAAAELEKFIRAGEATAKMKDIYKHACLQAKGSVEEAEQRLKELEEEAREKLKAELKKKMILRPAPDFVLVDLDGKSVSLSSLKGKTVILDFWATWCGPCLAAFPGMKIAVEKFKPDTTVEFLFVNSWERVEDWKKNALDFITKNNYPFHVLLDTENKVIAAYKVEGIPTKFVIDKKGKIRFESVGFSGNTEKMVEELSLLIEILR